MLNLTGFNKQRNTLDFVGSKLRKNSEFTSIVKHNTPYTSFLRSSCGFLSLLVLLLLQPSLSIFSQEKTYLRKVVIDAGHGGKDPGTVGKHSHEKDVVLAVALNLGNRIKEAYPDVKVIYTRQTDTFIELFQRAEIANKNKADLFISIHCNANRVKTFQGSETYVMGLHKTQQNLEISKLENASILMEPDYQVNYDGFDPNSDESYITFTLFQNAFLNQSLDFASMVQKELKYTAGMDDRGVRQAGFLVLYKTTMPSVLVETGFLSNAAEENFLTSKAGQDKISESIFKAFKSYKNQVEKGSTHEVAVQDDSEVIPPKVVNQPPPKKDPPIQKTESDKKSKPAVVTRDTTITFSVQIFLSPTEIGVTNAKFKGLKDVRFYKQDKQYKYYVGRFDNLDQANRYVTEIKQKGFKDAFVIAFKGDQRVTIKEARAELEKVKQ